MEKFKVIVLVLIYLLTLLVGVSLAEIIVQYAPFFSAQLGKAIFLLFWGAISTMAFIDTLANLLGDE